MESTALKLRCLPCWKENSGYHPHCYSCGGRLIAISPARVVSLIATLAVVAGLADLPYGYYMLLRFLLSASSVFLIFGADLDLEPWHRWVLGAFAVLYNPFLPIRPGDKEIWTVLNIITLVFFWAGTRTPR